MASIPEAQSESIKMSAASFLYWMVSCQGISLYEKHLLG